jgi:hypothetical protein
MVALECCCGGAHARTPSAGLTMPPRGSPGDESTQLRPLCGAFRRGLPLADRWTTAPPRQVKFESFKGQHIQFTTAELEGWLDKYFMD